MKIAAHDTRKAVERRLAFRYQFNRTDVTAIDPDETEYAAVAHTAVLGEIALAASATFVETFVRLCPDGITRVAGMVSFASSNGATSQAGYSVEFKPDGQPELLDLIVGVDPVSLKIVPERQPGGEVLAPTSLEPDPLEVLTPAWVIWFGIVIGAMLLIGIVASVGSRLHLW